MATLTTYELDQFVADMQDLIKGGPDQKTLFDRGSSYLERLVRNPNCIPEQFQRPVGGAGPRANHGSYALYRGEDRS